METPENIQINMYAVKFQPRRRQIVVEQGVAKHFDPRAEFATAWALEGQKLLSS